MVASAAQLCRAERASITLPKGDVFHRVASYGFSSEFREYMDRHPLPIERGNIVGRVVLEESHHSSRGCRGSSRVDFYRSYATWGVRTILASAMRQENPIGVLVLTRTVVEPFSAKQY